MAHGRIQSPPSLGEPLVSLRSSSLQSVVSWLHSVVRAFASNLEAHPDWPSPQIQLLQLEASAGDRAHAVGPRCLDDAWSGHIDFDLGETFWQDLCTSDSIEGRASDETGFDGHMSSFDISALPPGRQRETDHAHLVEAVKCQQRSSEIAREGWRHYCGALADGVRDPQILEVFHGKGGILWVKHSSEFLRNFLNVLETGQKIPQKHEDYELRLVRSGCPSLGAQQLELWMPESEVNANCYALAPGKSSLLSIGDVVLDVGAHLGSASALALRTPEVKVICVEPHPKTFEILHRNLGAAVETQRATLLNLAVAEGDETRDLFAHRGTNNPSRLFFASLFDTRSHADDPISVQCVALQDLIFKYDPSVVKIDAEGAERFLLGVEDFKSVRRLVVEWDWTHNKEQKCWDEVRTHLEHHDFKLRLRQALPTFDASGYVELTDPRGRKRGSTGMIFVATRKVKAERAEELGPSAPETKLARKESESETWLENGTKILT
eukprot:symbB.v1.2.007613.t1/scaffold467.1/size200107/8